MSEQSKQQLAAEKLKGELKKAKEKDFAEPVIAYLQERINEDEGLADDILKDGKTWSGCFSYVYAQAKKMAGGSRAIGVINDTVFEWAEDYFRKADKDLKADEKSTASSKKAKSVKKAKASPKETKTVDNVDNSVDKSTETVSRKPETTESVSEKPKKEKKSKQKKEDMSGQMSIFDLFGGLDG